MKTRNYQQFHDGDSCNVRPKATPEERLIEDHPQKLIEKRNQKFIGYTDEEAAFAAAPARRSGAGWWAWAVAGVIALFILAAGMYFITRDNIGVRDSSRTASLVTKPATFGTSANGSAGLNATVNGGIKSAAGATTLAAVDVTAARSANGAAAAAGYTKDYLYYFANNQSAVTANSRLDEVAQQIEDTGAEVVVTAYASQVGTPAYNEAISRERAQNVANYLVAHGVPRDHIKVAYDGATTQYGNAAHNRFADIHVTYPG